MISPRSALYVAILPLLFAGCASTPPGPLLDKGLPNFEQVDAHLFRGAKPLPAGYDELAKRGVVTVIDFRKPEAGEEERLATQEKDIEYIAEPMPGLRAPDRETAGRVLSVMNDPERQPVFIHCRRGADRTGTMVALYRITHDCWTAEKAIQEARAHGMSWVEFGMRRFIRNWYQEVQAQGCTPGG